MVCQRVQRFPFPGDRRLISLQYSGMLSISLRFHCLSPDMFCTAFSHAKPPRNIHAAREVTKNNSRRITYGIGCVWGMPSLSPLSSLGTNPWLAMRPKISNNSSVQSGSTRGTWNAVPSKN